MSITNVWIEDGCTACGLCEEICPDVFEMLDLAEVKENAVFDGNEDGIIEAAEAGDSAWTHSMQVKMKLQAKNGRPRPPLQPWCGAWNVPRPGSIFW